MQLKDENRIVKFRNNHEENVSYNGEIKPAFIISNNYQ